MIYPPFEFPLTPPLWNCVGSLRRVLTRPDVNKLPIMYRELGTDFNERVLPSLIHETLKSVVVRRCRLTSASPWVERCLAFNLSTS